MQVDYEKLGELWSAHPYGSYLNAVDDQLEAMAGRTSTQEELAYIAACQEERCPPSNCAASIIFDNWVSR